MVGCREISVVAGGILGATMGWIMGGLPGAALGCFLVSMLLYVPFEILHERSRRQKRAQLRGFFGEYHAPEKQDGWEQTKARLKSGDFVRGVVVHEGRSLVLVDIGCGFPASLSIARVPSELKESADDSPQVSNRLLPETGCEIEAQIMGFVDADREIEITQGGRWLLFEGEMVGFLKHAESPIEGRYYLRPTQNEAYAAFSRLPKSERTSRCEVLTGDETERVSAKREGFSGYNYVSISLLEGPSSPP